MCLRHALKLFAAVAAVPTPHHSVRYDDSAALVVFCIQEVIGSAIAILLLSQGAVPLWAGVIISAVGSFLLLFIERFGVRTLEGAFGVMISVMVGTFAVSHHIKACFLEWFTHRRATKTLLPNLLVYTVLDTS